ncbi:hypothetical protein PSTG_13825, partial [Puccinia striiformis f. sp. tritici PST-78]
MKCATSLSDVCLLATFIAVINASEHPVQNLLGQLAFDSNRDHTHKADIDGAMLRSTQNGPTADLKASGIRVNGFLTDSHYQYQGPAKIQYISFLESRPSPTTDSQSHILTSPSFQKPEELVTENLLGRPGGKQDIAHELGSGNIDFFNLRTRDPTSSSVSGSGSGINQDQSRNVILTTQDFLSLLGDSEKLSNMPSPIADDAKSSDRPKRKVHQENQHVSKVDNPSGLEIESNPPPKRLCGDCRPSISPERGNKDDGVPPLTIANHELQNFPPLSQSPDRAKRKMHHKKQDVSKSDKPSGLEIDLNPPAKRLCGGSWPPLSPETVNEDHGDLRSVETIQTPPVCTPKNDDIHLPRLGLIDFMNSGDLPDELNESLWRITNPTRVDESFRPDIFIKKMMFRRICTILTKQNHFHCHRTNGRDLVHIAKIWEFNSKFGQIWYSYWFRLTQIDFQSFIQEIISKGSSFGYSLEEFFPVFLLYVQMIITFIPRPRIDQTQELKRPDLKAELIQASEFFRDFQISLNQINDDPAKSNLWIAKKTSINGAIQYKRRNSIGILWSLLEVWIHTHYEPLWTTICQANSAINHNAKIVFNHVFCHSLENLTTLISHSSSELTS